MELFTTTATGSDVTEGHLPDPDAGFCLVCRESVLRAGLDAWVHQAS
jgi:hypothetical protein